MAKIALLLPFPEMCEVARPLAARYPKLGILCMEYVKTEEIADRARELEQQGCDLIIARGTQARIVKETVEVPLVEMRVTTQELGRVILQIKRDLGLERPRIGLLTFGNMVRDTGQFDDLFGIQFCRYMASSREELISSTERALADGCHAVIGGTQVCDHARGLGLPGYFLASGAESMLEALDTANRVCYAIDLEKRNSAEMTTILDNIFSGVLQVDREGIIHRVNRVGYDLLERRPEELLGRPVSQVLPELNPKALEGALVLGQEGYTLLTDARHRALIVNLAPIWVDGGLDGALLSIQEGKRVIEMDSELRRANTLLPSPRFSAKHLLLQLVNGDLTDEALIRFRADLVGQAAEGCFSLLLVDLKNFHPSHFSISSIQNTLENAARGYSVIRDETLIVLISHASEDERALAPLWEALEGILSANGIWGVRSRLFQRLGELHHHFLQTEKILDLRFCVQEANHLLSYDTMEVFSLVDLLSREGIAPSQPAVEALAGHDGKNGTMYTETLYTYLRCAQRPAEAAKRLFIHRNTLDYRIRRIGELADIDWGDGDLLFRLYLALSSLKYHAYKEGRLPAD